MYVGRGVTGKYYVIFQLSDYRRSIVSWVKIEGKRMINRIISYGGLKNGTICLLCPNCSSGVYAKFGTCSRGVRYYLGSLRTISVQRYHCKCCSSTLIWNELQKLGKLCKKVFEKLKCKFSGTVCIDEVWIRQIKGKYVYVFAWKIIPFNGKCG
jgi:hypothetical protein